VELGVLHALAFRFRKLLGGVRQVGRWVDGYCFNDGRLCRLRRLLCGGWCARTAVGLSLHLLFHGLLHGGCAIRIRWSLLLLRRLLGV
jgi:hypothetical protein